MLQREIWLSPHDHIVVRWDPMEKVITFKKDRGFPGWDFEDSIGVTPPITDQMAVDLNGEITGLLRMAQEDLYLTRYGSSAAQLLDWQRAYRLREGLRWCFFREA